MIAVLPVSRTMPIDFVFCRARTTVVKGTSLDAARNLPNAGKK